METVDFGWAVIFYEPLYRNSSKTVLIINKQLFNRLLHLKHKKVLRFCLQANYCSLVIYIVLGSLLYNFSLWDKEKEMKRVIKQPDIRIEVHHSLCTSHIWT